MTTRTIRPGTTTIA